MALKPVLQLIVLLTTADLVFDLTSPTLHKGKITSNWFHIIPTVVKLHPAKPLSVGIWSYSYYRMVNVYTYGTHIGDVIFELHIDI